MKNIANVERTKAYQAVYDQLTYQPRQDFFDMNHFSDTEEEAAFRNLLVNRDQDEAFELDTLSSDEYESEFKDDTESRELFSALWSGDKTVTPRVFEKFQEKASEIGDSYARRVSGDRSFVKDIKQAAQVGIGEAISSVLEHRTQLTKLESVMYFRIRGEVIKTFRTNNMFGSSAFGDVEYEFIKAERKLGAELGHTPTLSDISSELNWSIEETRLIRNGMTYHPGLSARSNPLDRPDTENSVMSNYVPGEVSARGLQELSTEQVVLERLSDEERDRAVTMTAVSALQRTNGISRDILDRYYGFGSYKKPQDAKVIAEEIGMGYENVRQILSRTRRRLRAELQSPYDPSEAEPTNSR